MERISNFVVSLHSVQKIWTLLRRLPFLRLVFVLDKRIAHHNECLYDLFASSFGRDVGVCNVLAELANHFQMLNFLIFLIEIFIRLRAAVVHDRS